MKKNKTKQQQQQKKFIAFKPCQKRTDQTIQLLIDGQKTDQVKETVFLGVHNGWKFKLEIWNHTCRQ